MQAITALPAPPGHTLLSARGLTKSFARGLARTSRRTVAIANADIEIRAGELIGVCGDEGAGKTTLLQSIAGLLRRDAGVIEVNGTQASEEFRRWVSFVPSSPVFYPFLTVRDVLELRLARASRNFPDDISVNRAMTALDLVSESACRVGLLDSETVRRVAVGEALVAGSRLVLVDAGSAATDLAGGPMLGALRTHATRGNAVVIAARSSVTLAGSASRFIFLEKGRIVPELFAANGKVV